MKSTRNICCDSRTWEFLFSITFEKCSATIFDWSGPVGIVLNDKNFPSRVFSQLAPDTAKFDIPKGSNAAGAEGENCGCDKIIGDASLSLDIVATKYDKEGRWIYSTAWIFAKTMSIIEWIKVCRSPSLANFSMTKLRNSSRTRFASIKRTISAATFSLCNTPPKENKTKQNACVH